MIHEPGNIYPTNWRAPRSYNRWKGFIGRNKSGERKLLAKKERIVSGKVTFP